MNTHEINKSDSTESITFKVSVQDKLKIQDQANSLNLSLSEFIRTKLLMDEESISKIIIENTELKKEMKENLVRATMPNLSDQDENSITLTSTKKGIEIIQLMLREIGGHTTLIPYSNFESKEDIESALCVIIADRLSNYVEDITGLRQVYGINGYEDFLKLLFEPYVDLIFSKKWNFKH